MMSETKQGGGLVPVALVCGDAEVARLQLVRNVVDLDLECTDDALLIAEGRRQRSKRLRDDLVFRPAALALALGRLLRSVAIGQWSEGRRCRVWRVLSAEACRCQWTHSWKKNKSMQKK